MVAVAPGKAPLTETKRASSRVGAAGCTGSCTGCAGSCTDCAGDVHGLRCWLLDRLLRGLCRRRHAKQQRVRVRRAVHVHRQLVIPDRLACDRVPGPVPKQVQRAVRGLDDPPRYWLRPHRSARKNQRRKRHNGSVPKLHDVHLPEEFRALTPRANRARRSPRPRSALARPPATPRLAPPRHRPVRGATVPGS